MKLRTGAFALMLAGLLAPAAQAQETASSGCELHVFPTVNYIGLNSGLLSGLGPIGAVADMEAHKGHVGTVKYYMSGYLGPEIQMEELNKIGLVKTLGLPPTRKSSSKRRRPRRMKPRPIRRSRPPPRR